MFITISLLGVLDLVQDIGVAASVSDNSTSCVSYFLLIYMDTMATPEEIERERESTPEHTLGFAETRD